MKHYFRTPAIQDDVFIGQTTNVKKKVSIGQLEHKFKEGFKYTGNYIQYTCIISDMSERSVLRVYFLTDRGTKSRFFNLYILRLLNNVL